MKRTACRPRLRALAVSSLAAAAALGLVACANSTRNATAGGRDVLAVGQAPQAAATPGTPAKGPAAANRQKYTYRDQDPYANLAAHVQGDRLVNPLAVRPGVLLSSPAARFAPGISRQQAFANYVAQEGQLPDTLSVRPRIFLARLTDSDMAAAGPAGQLIPRYKGTPVWVITYHRVHGNGASESGAGDPSAEQTSDAVPDVNVTGFVDAASGDFLFDLEDTVSQPVATDTSSP